MARSSLSRPGRNPARVNSLARLGADFLGICCFACTPKNVAARNSTAKVSHAMRPGHPTDLALRQNGIEARLKVVFSLAPQLAAFHRQSRFDCLHPAEQLLDVLAGFLVILLEVVRSGHPVAKCFLHRVIGTVERIFRRTGRQQSRVTGEEMFEAKISMEVSCGGGDAFVVGLSVAN